jgi:cell division protein ZapA
MDNNNSSELNQSVKSTAENFETEIVELKILDRVYRITCKLGESDSLKASAERIKNTLNELKVKAPGFNNEQLAILSALDLCHDLNHKELQLEELSDIVKIRMKEIREQIRNLKH